MSALSDFVGGSFPIVAGENISYRDPIQLAGGYGSVPGASTIKAKKIRNSSLAAIFNGGTALFAATNMGAWNDNVPSGAQAGSTSVQDAAGNTYVLMDGTNCTIVKYNLAGTNIGSVNAVTGNWLYGNIFFLSNGLLAVVGINSASNIPIAATINPTTMQVVTAATVLGNTSFNTPYGFMAIPLSGGGFAYAFQASGGYAIRFGIYSNTCTVVVAEYSLSTNNSSQGWATLAQLSSGSILVAYNTGSTSVLSLITLNPTTGATVNSVPSFATGITCTIGPKINVLASGYFALISSTGSGASNVYVLNNALAQQGTSLAINWANSNYGTYAPCPVSMCNDGTQFWIYNPCYNNTGNRQLIALPVTGGANAVVNYIYTAAGALSTYVANAAANSAIATDGNGYFVAIVTVYSAAGTAAFTEIINNNGSLPVVTNKQNYGSTSVTGYRCNIFIMSDLVYMYTGSASAGAAWIGGIKYENTAIFGISTAAATIGNLVSVITSRVGGGTYVGWCNTISYSSNLPLTFDCTSGSNIYGNKGTLFSNGMTLKGM